MRKLALILALSMLGFFVKAQTVFCPPGAEWRALYNISWSIPNASTNNYIKYIGDSISGTDVLKKLKHRKFYRQCNYEPQDYITAIKQKGDTIFMFNKYTFNKWEILFNYACQPGTGWTTTYFALYSNNGINTYSITVDSTKIINENNFNLKQLITTVRYKFGNKVVSEVVRINERYGPVFLFHYEHGPGCDNDFFLNALCYSDDAFGVKQFTSDACDYSNPVGIQNITIENEKFRIFPNPVGENLNVETEAVNEKYVIRIVDIYGKEYSQSKIESKTITTNVKEIAAGVYFLQIVQDGKVVSTQKIIKE